MNFQSFQVREVAEVVACWVLSTPDCSCLRPNCGAPPFVHHMVLYAIKDGTAILHVSTSRHALGYGDEFIYSSVEAARVVANETHQRMPAEIQKTNPNARITNRHVEIRAKDPREIARKLEVAGLTALFVGTVPAATAPASPTTPPPMAQPAPKPGVDNGSRPPAGGGL